MAGHNAKIKLKIRIKRISDDSEYTKYGKASRSAEGLTAFMARPRRDYFTFMQE
jgi:hypothetical protein